MPGVIAGKSGAPSAKRPPGCSRDRLEEYSSYGYGINTGTTVSTADILRLFLRC